MFDFEKLEVYQMIRKQNYLIYKELINKGVSDKHLEDQLKRASISVMLNLSEGSGRMSKADKKRFYVMSRSSLNETISILQIMLDLNMLDNSIYETIYESSESISRMLLAMIRSMKE